MAIIEDTASGVQVTIDVKEGETLRVTATNSLRVFAEEQPPGGLEAWGEFAKLWNTEEFRADMSRRMGIPRKYLFPEESTLDEAIGKTYARILTLSQTEDTDDER